MNNRVVSYNYMPSARMVPSVDFRWQTSLAGEGMSASRMASSSA